MDKKDNNTTNGQQERLDAYRKALDEAFRVASDPDIDERTVRMMERLDARIESYRIERTHTRKVLISLSAVACLAVAAVFIWKKQPSSEPFLAFENAMEEVRRVSLPDGTSVSLKHGAVLYYTERGGIRQAELRGEAYFDVARDSLRAFLVKTSGIDIKVIGTAFSVSAIPGYAKSDVILERGSVYLQRKSGAPILRLSPNQKALVDSSTGDISVEQVAAKLSIQQQFGMVSLENARMDEILRAIESQFGIRVNASGYNPAIQYNVYFFRSDNPAEVLAMLEVLTGGHFSSDNSRQE